MLLNIDPNGKGWIDWAATKVPPPPPRPAPPAAPLTRPLLILSSLILTVPLSVLQLSGLTSALPDTVLPHLFSQVSLHSRGTLTRLPWIQGSL